MSYKTRITILVYKLLLQGRARPIGSILNRSKGSLSLGDRKEVTYSITEALPPPFIEFLE